MNNLTCNGDKLAAIITQLSQNPASGGKHEILAEHITSAHSSLFMLSALFNVCLMHGKIYQHCMKTVFVPICKIIMVTYMMLVLQACFSCNNYLWTTSWALTIFYPTFHHFLPTLTCAVLNQNIEHGNDLCVFLLKHAAQCNIEC